MKYLRADFRFSVPDDFKGNAVEASRIALDHLASESVPDLKHTACFPTAHAEMKGINGQSPYYFNLQLGHKFTGFLGAYHLAPEFASSWVELPSGVLAHGSCSKGWIK